MLHAACRMSRGVLVRARSITCASAAAGAQHTWSRCRCRTVPPGTGVRDRYAQLEDGFSSEFEFVAPLLLLWSCPPAEYSPSTLSPSVLLQRRVLQVRSGWRAAHRALQPAEQRLARRGAHTGRRQWIGCALARAHACRRCGEARGIALDSSDTRVVRSTIECDRPNRSVHPSHDSWPRMPWPACGPPWPRGHFSNPARGPTDSDLPE